MIYHPYLVVIGRVDGAENNVRMYERLTLEQAHDRFVADEHAAALADGNETATADDVYVDYIFTSDAPIGFRGIGV